MTQSWLARSIHFSSLASVIFWSSAVMLPEIHGKTSSVQGSQVISNNSEIFVPYQGERFSIFDWNLCKLMAARYHGNILISPVSLKLALVLLYEGAQDQTAHELARVLHLPAGQTATRDKFSMILQSLEEISNHHKLNLGTRIFIDNNVSLKQSYSAIIKTFYSSDVITSNFTNTRLTMESINSWIRNTTDGNIQRIISDENSLKDCIMMVLNVIYFKGFWLGNIFHYNNTKVNKFYENSNKSFDINFMTTYGHFYYVESPELDAAILRIPYEGRKYAIYLILPRMIGGLDHVIKNMNSLLMSRLVETMQKLPVEVTIPKFKFVFTSRLESILREMGIRDIFDNTAILTGIAKAKRSQSLIVTDIIQKAGIELNEHGTTAYAATEVNVGNKVADQEFNANHPFVFYIEDETTGTIIYVGRMSNPLESSGSTEMSMRSNVPISVEGKTTEGISTVSQIDDGINVESNYFNIDLLQIVNNITHGNIAISPFSIKMGLSILLEGAGGRTREELLSALRLPADQQKTRNISLQSLQLIQNNGANTEINLANRLWIGKLVEFPRKFNNLLETYYGGDSQPIMFSTLASLDLINSWVQQVTKHHICSIVDPGSFEVDTQLLLTSALYFKGKWKTAFDKNVTREHCFFTPEEGCHLVPMMEDLRTLPYAKIPSLNFELLEIPYDDGRLSMLVFLSLKKTQDFQTLLKDIARIPMLELLSYLEETKLVLLLPRFSIESKINLQSALEHLGIQNLFNYNANLTGIFPNDGARIDRVSHSAKIEVNEQGTIGSAVTAFSITPLMGSTHEVFRVNRPFLFMIIDRPSGIIIFAGRITQPLND